jgi:hypothetical protein
MLNPTPRRKERGPRLAKFSLLKGATAAGSHICSEEQKRDRHFRGLHKVTGTGPLSWRSSDVAVESSASRRWNHASASSALRVYNSCSMILMCLDKQDWAAARHELIG